MLDNYDKIKHKIYSYNNFISFDRHLQKKMYQSLYKKSIFQTKICQPSMLCNSIIKLSFTSLHTLQETCVQCCEPKKKQFLSKIEKLLKLLDA